MKDIRHALFVASVIPASGMLADAAAPAKPDIVHITADDAGYSNPHLDLTCHSSE